MKMLLAQPPQAKLFILQRIMKMLLAQPKLFIFS